MTKLEFIKGVSRVLVGTGTFTIVSTIVARNVPVENIFNKVTVFSSRVALSSVVIEVAKNQSDKKIDAVASWWTQNVK